MAYNFPEIGFIDLNVDSPRAIAAKDYEVGLDGIVLMRYLPKKGTVVVTGYTEILTNNPQMGQFYVDYQDQSSYHAARGIMKFNLGEAGNTVNITYSGVGIVCWAEYLNFIVDHINADAIAHLTSAEHTKLTSLTATPSADSIVESTTKKVLTSTERTKLAGIAAGATAYTHPATHTGAVLGDEWFLVEMAFQNPADNQLIIKFECPRNCTIKGAKIFGDVAPTASTSIVITNTTTATVYQTMAISVATPTTWTASAGVNMDAGQYGSITVSGTSGMKTHNYTVAVRAVNR